MGNNKPLYRALRKYGPENFSIEEIDHTDDFNELGQLERYYIQKYNSQDNKVGYNLTAGGEKNQWDGNPASKLTFDDVVNIRTKFAECKLSKKECWKLYYRNKISFSTFDKVWNGRTWQDIMPEVYTEENINFHKSQTGLPGSKNAHAKLTEEQVLNIRKYYVNHTLQETYEKYGNDYTLDGFRGILTRTYSDVPIYKKIKHEWVLHGKIIQDIDSYNPVSTISESGE